MEDHKNNGRRIAPPYPHLTLPYPCPTPHLTSPPALPHQVLLMEDHKNNERRIARLLREVVDHRELRPIGE